MGSIWTLWDIVVEAVCFLEEDRPSQSHLLASWDQFFPESGLLCIWVWERVLFLLVAIIQDIGNVSYTPHQIEQSRLRAG